MLISDKLLNVKMWVLFFFDSDFHRNEKIKRFWLSIFCTFNHSVFQKDNTIFPSVKNDFRAGRRSIIKKRKRKNGKKSIEGCNSVNSFPLYHYLFKKNWKHRKFTIDETKQILFDFVLFISFYAIIWG